jgi:hypothetical protein
MLPLIAHDKANHYLYGSVIALVTFLVAFNIPSVAVFASIAALIATTIMAVAKELYDKYSGTGTPDFYDIVYTVAGGIVVLLPVSYATWVP